MHPDDPDQLTFEDLKPPKKVLVTFEGDDYVLHPRARASLMAAADRWGCEFRTLPTRSVNSNWWWTKPYLLERVPDADVVYWFDGDTLVKSDAPDPLDEPGADRADVLLTEEHNALHLLETRRPREMTPEGRLRYWADAVKMPVPSTAIEPNTGVMVIKRNHRTVNTMRLAAGIAKAGNYVNRTAGSNSWTGADQIPLGIAFSQCRRLWLGQEWNCAEAYWDAANTNHWWVIHFNAGGWKRKEPKLNVVDWETPRSRPLQLPEVHKGVPTYTPKTYTGQLMDIRG